MEVHLCIILHTLWKSWSDARQRQCCKVQVFPTSRTCFLPKFHVKYLTWNVGSEVAFLRRQYTFNIVIMLSGWENVSWQMQRKPFMQKNHSGSQRHWNRMSKVLAVLTTYGKGTVPATGWESVFIKFATAKRLSASNYWDFYEILTTFCINQCLAHLQKTSRIKKKGQNCSKIYQNN